MRIKVSRYAPSQDSGQQIINEIIMTELGCTKNSVQKKLYSSTDYLERSSHCHELNGSKKVKNRCSDCQVFIRKQTGLLIGYVLYCGSVLQHVDRVLQLNGSWIVVARQIGYCSFIGSDLILNLKWIGSGLWQICKINNKLDLSPTVASRRRL